MKNIKVYRRNLSGLGSLGSNVSSKAMRIHKLSIQGDQLQQEQKVTPQQVRKELKKQGGNESEISRLIQPGQAFETSEAFYFVASDELQLQAALQQLIVEHLDQCNGKATPEICEMIRTPEGKQTVVQAVEELATREMIGIGAAINALEGQLA